MKKELIVLAVISLFAFVVSACSTGEAGLTKEEFIAEAELIADEQLISMDEASNLVGMGSAQAPPTEGITFTECTDTDGGVTYGQYGTVTLSYYREFTPETINTRTARDQCSPATGRLVEYSCRSDNSLLITPYRCPQGCANGACVAPGPGGVGGQPNPPMVCPQGNVKFEVGQGIVYTDNSATISVNGNQATWAPAEGSSINRVCVKIGGPGGGALIYPVSEISSSTLNPRTSYTSPTYGIGHVVVYT